MQSYIVLTLAPAMFPFWFYTVLKGLIIIFTILKRSEEGEKAVRGQSHIQDIDEGVEAMLAITAAANRSSLADFK